MSGIVIHRSRHAQQYVVIPNAIARDSALSFGARGLLTFLLSLPSDWHVTTDMLAVTNPDPRSAIRAWMAELRHAGYVELNQERGVKGRWYTRFEVFDTTSSQRRQSASGATSENSASSQVAPRAGRPAPDGWRLSTSKYGKPRGQHRRTGDAAAKPAAPPTDCARCGKPPDEHGRCSGCALSTRVCTCPPLAEATS